MLSSSWSHPPSSARNRGIIGVIISVGIFVYYIVWVVITPFYDGKTGGIEDIGISSSSSSSLLHRIFPLPRSVAIEIPVSIGIIMLGIMTLYLGYIFTQPETTIDKLTPTPQAKIKRKRELTSFWEQLASPPSSSTDRHHNNITEPTNPLVAAGRSKSE
ncbi:hypothetical protein FOZ62_019571 [Perkinsus olseni]|uniref:Dolichol phosphate-mannose biosynthesis regulatory protein n=1 Tax=Perkinsus olseni TaxID=32597 RepID=A0A7J6R7J8_PEROL|nr:hypothetical protein FOZ62_019571 [Perkinsus olseni]